MRFLTLFFVSLLVLACDSDETRRDRFFLQGNQALENNEYKNAIEYYNKALAIDPEHAFSYNNRGVARYEDGHPYEALQDYNQAILRKPNYYESIQNRANVYQEIGKYDKAIEDLEYLIQAYPDSTIFYFQKGLVQTYKADYESARSSFLIAKEQDSTDPEIEINLATLDYYEGDYSGSKDKLQRVLQEFFGLAMAWNTLNQVYIAQEKYDSALYAINKALEIEQNEGIFLNNRGFTYLMLDSLETGLEDINKSILQDPQNQWAYRNKAIYYIKSDEPDLAIPYLEDLQDKNELIDDKYYYLGIAYQMKGQTKKACEVWAQGSPAEIRSKEAFEESCR